jgi:hypothetical protein
MRTRAAVLVLKAGTFAITGEIAITTVILVAAFDSLV